jgi:antitoxin (DNA-binding transcriptional repressor) of toxin-antitoxin stability system
MKIANLARAKDDLSRYVDYVRRGGRVRILVSGVPAADLVPVAAAANDAAGDGDLADLERQGILRRGSGGAPREILRPGPKLRGKPSSVTVATERNAGW